MLCELLAARLQALQQRASAGPSESASDSERAEVARELARLGALLHNCQAQAQHEAFLTPTSMSWARRLWLASARWLALMLLVVLLDSYVLPYAWSALCVALRSLPLVSGVFRQREASRSERFDESLSAARERMQARQGQQQQSLRDTERMNRVHEARRRQQLST